MHLRLWTVLFCAVFSVVCLALSGVRAGQAADPKVTPKEESKKIVTPAETKDVDTQSRPPAKKSSKKDNKNTRKGKKSFFKGDDKMFNPQPEPPGEEGKRGKDKKKKGNKEMKGSDKMFNPQPEPPVKK